jgi:hypothetical protein
MSNTYKTNITSLTVVPSQDNLTNVVVTVNWCVQATNGTYYAQISGSNEVGPPNPTDFTDFSKLTEEQVLGWIPDPKTETVVNQLDAGIAAQVNPPIVNMIPPWVDA